MSLLVIADADNAADIELVLCEYGRTQGPQPYQYQGGTDVA